MKIALLPDIINKEEEYKAKEVQNCRKQGHNTQFLVTGNVMEMSMTNVQQKWDYHMLKR